MKRVKESVHYWCEDIKAKRCLGQGITVAVLDTGIAPHPDFKGKVLVFHDFVNGQDLVYDDNGHGTHVCGIIGGSGYSSNGEYAGIAPKCDLVILKVLDQDGNGHIEQMLQAIQWILEYQKRYGIRIINISVGMEAKQDSREEKRLVSSVEELWDAGMIVVAAAGNLGPKKGSVTIPGISKKVITVGSSDEQLYTDEREGTKSNYSGRGPTKECVCKPDVVAPGNRIVSCNSRYISQRGKPYILKSGTSMSTPVVSGAIADLLSKYPDMSNTEVKLRLRETSRDLGLEKNQQGWGILDLESLLKNF